MLSSDAAKSGARGVSLASGEQISQYVYLDNSRDYEMTFSHKGTVEVTVENIVPVAGTPENRFGGGFDGKARWMRNKIRFTTGAEFEDNKKTVRVTFKNSGRKAVSIDDICVKKD